MKRTSEPTEWVNGDVVKVHKRHFVVIGRNPETTSIVVYDERDNWYRAYHSDQLKLVKSIKGI